MRRKIRIAGSRGIPADHGGFETFCERISLGLRANGWEVSVYCQERHGGPIQIDEWNGIKRIRVPVSFSGPLSTIAFDFKSIIHAMGSQDPVLILGYNTAVFSVALRLKRIPVIFNMDGIEWAREKWSWYERAWLYANEMAAWIGNQLIACGVNIYIAMDHRLLGEIALKTEIIKAEGHFKKSIDVCREIKAEHELALAYAGYGRLLQQQGRIVEAREYLTLALHTFERLGTLIEPDLVRQELAKLP